MTAVQLKGVKSPDMKIACGCSPGMWSPVRSESPCNEITHLQTMQRSTTSARRAHAPGAALLAFFVPCFAFYCVCVDPTSSNKHRVAADQTHQSYAAERSRAGKSQTVNSCAQACVESLSYSFPQTAVRYLLAQADVSNHLGCRLFLSLECRPGCSDGGMMAVV